jgi:hypothetical protein
MFERLKFLAEGEVDKTGGAGGTSTTDADATAAAAKAEADKAAAAAGDKKTDAAAPARKSVLSATDEKKDEKGGKGAAGAKDGEAKADDAGASDYVVKLPEGMKETDVDKAQLAEFTSWAKEHQLKPEQASEALAFWQKQQAAETQRWAKQDQDWYGALEKDSEFGGQNLKASEANLQKALKVFDTDGSLAKDLAKYGLENLPSLAKTLARIGKAHGEDKPNLEKAKTDAAPKLSSAERRKSFYDDMKPVETAK